MQLNFETHGTPNNPSLLLVHGFLSSNAQWIPNIESLKDRFFLVTAELWGHGNSPLPQSELTVDGYIDAFEDIRTLLNIELWGVVGQSYAAGLAIRYSIKKPDVVSHLLVTNSRSALGDLAANGPRRSTQAKSEPREDNRHLPIHPIYAKRIPEPTLSALIKAADETSAETIERGGRLGAKLGAKTLLGDIPCPFVIANGIFEKSFQKDVEQLRAENDVKVVDLRGGHAVNIEAAEEFNALVIKHFG